MWSNREHINSTINILLFLLAINFLHLGQLLLPIICLIIFIDSKLVFKVNNLLTFIILCLFGITFLCFSYRTGFYSTMGLCLPMAYYIGSNVKNHDEESIKNVVYLLTFGMALHLVFNFIFEAFIDGINLFNSVNHYDVWIKDYIPTTALATNLIFILSLIYYIAFREKNKTIKTIGLVLFSIVIFYNLALGRRTPLLMLGLCVTVSFVIDKTILNNKRINTSKILKIFGVCLLAIIIVVSIYEFNIFNCKEFINNLGIVKKFVQYGFDTGRLDIFFGALKLMPTHLWGNQEIHNILGIQVHDLWMDTFDYAGIIPFVLLIIHSIIFVLVFINLLKNRNISKDFKMFVVVLFFAVTIQLFLEPIMSGSSLFIIIVVLVEAILENKLIYESK